MKKAGVVLVLILLLSTAVSAFSLTDYFSSLFSAQATTITGTQANPIKVYPGQSLNILVAFEDLNNIESAIAYFPYEGGQDKVDMILSAGNENKGTYSATWVVHDTLNQKWYKTKVILTNSLGTETIAYVDWQDPTQYHPAEQVYPGDFPSGNFTFNGSQKINSIKGIPLVVEQTKADSGFNYVLFINQTGTFGTNYGVYSIVNSSGVAAIYGKMTAFNNTISNIGVFGESASRQGTGVYGYASSPSSGSDLTYGVVGKVDALTGFSGWFSGGVVKFPGRDTEPAPCDGTRLGSMYIDGAIGGNTNERYFCCCIRTGGNYVWRLCEDHTQTC